MTIYDVERSLKKPQRRGFTLTELAIVLGVIGAILGAIWGAAARVNANNKAQTAIRQILNIASGVRAAYPSGSVSTAAWITGYAINSGIMPSEMLSTNCSQGQGGTSSAWSGTVNGATTCAFNSWGMQMLVGVGGAAWGVTTSTNTFLIGINGYNAAGAQINTTSVCASFLPALVQQAANAGALTQVYSDGSGLYPATPNAQTLAAASISQFQNCAGNVALLFSF